MNCDQQEWIDSYLFGELEGAERRQFEAKYATDEAFRAEVDLQAEIMVGVNSYCASKPTVHRPKVVSMSNTKKIWLSIAAAIALAFMVQVTINTAIPPASQIVEQQINKSAAKQDNMNDFEKPEPVRPPYPIYSNLLYVALSFA